jgi:hypothetical protein
MTIRRKRYFVVDVFQHQRGTPPRACINCFIFLYEFRFRWRPVGADGDPTIMLILVD